MGFDVMLVLLAGKVYKGIPSNGQHVAVKHIPNDGEMETFVHEVTNLLTVRHPNLVTLLGHCKGEYECFLIYELCHNGNLSKWLFGILLFPLVDALCFRIFFGLGESIDKVNEPQAKIKFYRGAKGLRLE